MASPCIRSEDAQNLFICNAYFSSARIASIAIDTNGENQQKKFYSFFHTYPETAM